MDCPLFDLPYCPITPAMKVLGGKWKLEILYHVSCGHKRFGELLRQMPGISRTILAQQLRELERDGLLLRADFAEVPPRVEYTVTPLAETAWPVVQAIATWGRAWVERTAAPAPAPAPAPAE